MNPEKFVERLDPKVKAYRVTPMPWAFQGNPGPTAIEAYQRTRRRVTAAGGVPQLHHEHSLGREAKGRPKALAFVPRGDAMVVATDRALNVVDLETWSITPTCRTRRGWQAVDISQRGWVALGSYRGDLAILDSDLNALVEVPARDLRRGAGQRSDRLTTISWSSTSELVAAAVGRTIYVVEVPSGKVHHRPFPERQEGPLEALQARFVPGSGDLLIADGTTKLSIIDALSGEVRAALTTAHQGERPDAPPSSGRWLDIKTAAISPDGELVAFAGSDGLVALARCKGLEVTDLYVFSDPTRHRLEVCAVAFSPDGSRLAIMATDDEIVIGDLVTSAPLGVAQLPGPDYEFSSSRSPCVAWSPDSARVATVSFGAVAVWST